MINRRLMFYIKTNVLLQPAENDQKPWKKHHLPIHADRITETVTIVTKRSSDLLYALVPDVLAEVLQLFQRGDGVWSDAIRHGAQDVAQILVLLQQKLQLLHPMTLLLHQSLHLSADVLLLLEHADASLLLHTKQSHCSSLEIVINYSQAIIWGSLSPASAGAVNKIE